MKKILFLLLFIIPISVSARSKTSCDYKLVSNLKKLASNVDITYTYKIVEDNVYYDVTISNIQENIYFKTNFSNDIYYYSDTNNGEIVIENVFPGNNKFTFYSSDSGCLNEKLVVKNINLPYYNRYYNYDECKGIEDFSSCQRWSLNNDDYNTFLEKTLKYKSSLEKIDNGDNVNKNLSFFQKLINYFVNYFYLIIPLITLFIVGIMYLFRFIKNRKNRFDI